MTNFKELGLNQKLLKSIANVGYETPTPIQEQAIPLVMEGHDIMGLAQTGTGKTAAFGLPLVNKLMEEDIRPKPKSVRALILAPTRELVNQISDNLRQYVKKTPIWVNVVIGGQSISNQARTLSKGTDILVATPGRLLDLSDRKAVHLDSATFLVLDEADQMLDLGFIHSLRQISKLLGTPRQTLLFSATMPKQVDDLSKAFLKDPVRVEVSPPGKAADKIEQSVHHVSARDKTNLLKDCLIKHDGERTLVFARTKHGAEKLMKHLVDCGFKADSIHGNKSQGQRDRAIRSFKKQDIDILVATDVAARGIDIPGVNYVYNFNLPEVAENYVHRIGRTARAGAEGKAVAFCAPDEYHLLRQIEKLMSISITIESGEEPQGSFAKKSSSNNRSRGRNKKPAGAGSHERGSRDRKARDSGNRDRGPRDQRAQDKDTGERSANERGDRKRQPRDKDAFDRNTRNDKEAGRNSRGGNRSKPDRNSNKDFGKKRSRFNEDNNEQSAAPSRAGKPGKFKNKQQTVTEFDAREKRRKERENNPEQSNNNQGYAKKGSKNKDTCEDRTGKNNKPGNKTWKGKSDGKKFAKGPNKSKSAQERNFSGSKRNKNPSKKFKVSKSA